ncbi:HVO_A0114 family putative DNA-binding protein [Lamprocystis purpurea]|jgi:predicted transcriptional regulator|uniref:HVO_A0114 family putative DNA-binding protein n=1 Tax=Lamprocystis purpurea TaxID=61598 RepID=UPI00037569FF|nr:hypothetical protein [Lamprocystis purpurea]
MKDETQCIRAAGTAGLHSHAGAWEREDRGETLHFDTPGAFFSKLTERRWALLRLLQGTEEMSERELARRAARDVKRVHEDVAALADLGLVERTERGGIVCPFADIHVDMHLREAV